LRCERRAGEVVAVREDGRGPVQIVPTVEDEEVLTRLGLADEVLVDAIATLDDHSVGDERIEAPAQRHFHDEAQPPVLLAVAEKVLAADVSEDRTILAMRELTGSDVPRLLETVAEAARIREARHEWRRSSRDAGSTRRPHSALRQMGHHRDADTLQPGQSMAAVGQQ